MKKSYLLLLVLFLVFSSKLHAQDQTASVEKNVTGVQIGLFGVDVYNEFKLANALALRAEASMFPAVWGGDMYPKTGFAFYPAITIQPKWYYNLNRRVHKDKSIHHNSGNYIGVQMRYLPDLFIISNEDNVNLNNQIDIIPTYGIRRALGANFNYEFRTGLGYGTTVGLNNNQSGLVLDISLKIGFDF